MALAQTETRHRIRCVQSARNQTTRPLPATRDATGFAMTITMHTTENVWSGPIVVVVNTKAAFPRQQTIVSVCHARLRALAIRI